MTCMLTSNTVKKNREERWEFLGGGGVRQREGREGGREEWSLDCPSVAVW